MTEGFRTTFQPTNFLIMFTHSSSMPEYWERGHEAGMKAYCKNENKEEAKPTSNEWGEELRNAWEDGWNDAKRLDEKGNLNKEAVLS